MKSLGAHFHRRPLSGIWVRALHPKYLAAPLGTAHTATHATRFNPGSPTDPGFELLYLAEDATVALFEVQALLGSPYPGAAFVASPAGGTWTLVNVDVKLQSVIDFTKRTSRKSVDTSVQELTGDWRAYTLRNPARKRGGIAGSDAPTQILGHGLERMRDVEGFLCYSARVATRRTLMIFPHKLLPGSSFRYQHPVTKKWIGAAIHDRRSGNAS